MVTLTELVLRSKQRCDLEHSNHTDSDESAFIVNSSAAELYGLLVTSYEDYFTTTLEFDVSAPDDGYSVPFPVMKIRGLDISIGGQYVNVHKSTFEDRNIVGRPFNVIQNTRGIRYREVGSQIQLTPGDQASGHYRLWYIPRFTPMGANDSLDDNSSIGYWHEYIVVDAAIKMAQKEESDAVVGTLMAQKQILKERIENEAANRDAAYPERVTDVNQQSNDLSWRFQMPGVLKKLNHEDPLINRVQENVDEAISPLLRDPSNFGNLLKGVTLMDGYDSIIPHKLGRKLIGWQVIDIDADATVWRVANLSPTLNLTLRASALCTVSLKVF